MTETQEDPLEFTREAVALVPDDPTNARAKVLSVHARMLARYGHFKEGREVAMTALALAERLDMPRLASDIRTTLVGLEKKGGPSESLIEALRSAIAGAVEAGASNTELRALLLLGNHHLDNAEFAEADDAFSQRDDARQGRGHALGPLRRRGALDARRLAAHAGPVGRRAEGARRLARGGPTDLRRPVRRHPLADPGRPRRRRGRAAGPQPAVVLARGGSGRHDRRLGRDGGRGAPR